MPSLGRALRHRNYRLFFSGQSISLIGTWLTRFATGWAAVTLTHDPFVLGLVAFFGQAPTSLIAPIAGVLVDRWDRHRVLVVTQIAAMLQSAALAFFALAGLLTIWHLIALGAVQAVINAFDMPARQSFLGQMIEDRADLPNAIALNSTMVNGARMLGPVIAAALVHAAGIGWCFAIDAASYLAVIASLLAMRIAVHRPLPTKGHVLHELRDGIRYVAREPLVRAVLLLLATTSVLAGAYTTLLPLVAVNTLQGDSDTLGILMASAGVGALVGALYLASRSSVVGLGRVIGRCVFGLGAALVALELAHDVIVAAAILFVLGGSLMVQMAATNTIVQTVTDRDKLGRVMSLYAVAFFSGAPVGSLLLGALARRIGPIHAFAVAGGLVLVSAIVFVRAMPKIRIASRPTYVRLGLIEE